MEKKKYLKIALWILTGALIPFIINLVSNFFTWYKTKDNVEITLKLEGWITIGSVEFSDLPNLKLFLDSEEVNNILKVSWSIINTGNKGIEKFESGPFIEFPNDLNVVSARIDETSPFLKVAKKPIISGNKIFIDSLGILNSFDNMKVDVYLKNILEKDASLDFFDKWDLKGKALNLLIRKDIQQIKKTSNKTLFETLTMRFSFIVLLILLCITILEAYIRRISKNIKATEKIN